MFKVGDKVQLKEGVCFSCRGKVLTIIALPNSRNRYIQVTWSEIVDGCFPLRLDEIEKIAIKGQQLLFGFMK